MDYTGLGAGLIPTDLVVDFGVSGGRAVLLIGGRCRARLWFLDHRRSRPMVIPPLTMPA